MKGEISGSVCNFNKDKLSNKPEQIQVLLRILSVWCGGVRTRETLNSLALCVDMRIGPFTRYGCLLSTHFPYLYTSSYCFEAFYRKNRGKGKEYSWWAVPHLLQFCCFSLVVILISPVKKLRHIKGYYPQILCPLLYH